MHSIVIYLVRSSISLGKTSSRTFFRENSIQLTVGYKKQHCHFPFISSRYNAFISTLTVVNLRISTYGKAFYCDSCITREMMHCFEGHHLTTTIKALQIFLEQHQYLYNPDIPHVQFALFDPKMVLCLEIPISLRKQLLIFSNFSRNFVKADFFTAIFISVLSSGFPKISGNSAEHFSI